MNTLVQEPDFKILEEDIYSFHITLVLHDTRQSGRMEYLGIKKNKNPIYLSAKEEIKLTEIVRTIVNEKDFIVWAYNICRDHVHMILVSEENELSKIVQEIKGVSARRFNQWKNINLLDKGFKPLATNSLWAQKFNRKPIQTEEQLHQTIQYIQLNRQKHNLSENKQLNQIIHGTIRPIL